jgi:hypothetical protein
VTKTTGQHKWRVLLDYLAGPPETKGTLNGQSKVLEM